MQMKRSNTWARTATAVLGVLAAVGLSGCIVLSVHPLYNEGETVHDPGLVGVWGDPEDPDGETWQFLADGRGGYRLIIRENDTLKVRPGEDGVFAARLVDLGDNRFMDLFPEEPEGASEIFLSHVVPGHSLWRLERQGNVLILGLMGEQAFSDVDSAGRLELDMVERDGVTVLTAPTERLREALTTHADALFPDSETLQRLQ